MNQCFQHTALVWIPCLCLWIFSPFLLYSFFSSKKRRPLQWSRFIIFKVVIKKLSPHSLKSPQLYNLDCDNYASLILWKFCFYFDDSLIFSYQFGELLFSVAYVYFRWNVLLQMVSALLTVDALVLLIVSIAQSHAADSDKTAAVWFVYPALLAFSTVRWTIWSLISFHFHFQAATVPLLIFCRIRGVITSGVLFVFWLLLTICGLPEFSWWLRNVSSCLYTLFRMLIFNILHYMTFIILYSYINWFV